VDYHVEHIADGGWIDVDEAESMITACTTCLPSSEMVRGWIGAVPSSAPAALAPPQETSDPEALSCDRCGRVFAPGERHMSVDYSVERQIGQVSVSVEEACWLVMRCLGCAPGRDAVIAALGLPPRPCPDSRAAVLNELDRELDEGALQ
jgi:hypothetical protein